MRKAILFLILILQSTILVNAMISHHQTGKLIQLIPTEQSYNYIGYNNTRLIYNNLWYYNIRGLEVNVTTNLAGMTIIANQSILAIGYVMPGYYEEISVDYSYNLQGAFGVFLKIFNFSSEQQFNPLNSIVIAFYKPPTAQPPDAVFLYNVTFPVIINGTETDVEFGVYESPVHTFYIPYTPLFGNVTILLNYFTENAGYYKPYLIGIFNHAAIATEKHAVAFARVYNLFLIGRDIFNISIPKVLLINGVLTVNGTSVVSENSYLITNYGLDPISARSNSTNSLAYVESNFNTVSVNYDVTGDNFFGAKIYGNPTTIYLFLYSPIEETSTNVVYLPLIINGQTEFVMFYEIVNGTTIYLYPQENIEGNVVIDFNTIGYYFKTSVKMVAIGDVYFSEVNFKDVTYQVVTPTKAEVTVVSEMPYYYINGTEYYTNKTYFVNVPAILCIPTNLTINSTKYTLEIVEMNGVELPNKLILSSGTYEIEAIVNQTTITATSTPTTTPTQTTTTSTTTQTYTTTTTTQTYTTTTQTTTSSTTQTTTSSTTTTTITTSSSTTTQSVVIPASSSSEKSTSSPISLNLGASIIIILVLVIAIVLMKRK